jgi:hypothetical protein
VIKGVLQMSDVVTDKIFQDRRMCSLGAEGDERRKNQDSRFDPVPWWLKVNYNNDKSD